MPKTVRGTLSRDRILAAAVRLVDLEGIHALSMRRLGAALGVEAMSLYNHIPNKEALLDGMVEAMLSEMELKSVAVGWEEQVRDGYRSFRKLAHRHPHIFPLLVTRPPDSPDGVWLVEAFLRSMQRAGFRPETSLSAFRTLSNYTFAYATSEIRGFALEPKNGQDPAADLPASKFPRVAALKPYLRDVDHDAEFEFGLDIIFAGLRQRLAEEAP